MLHAAIIPAGGPLPCVRRVTESDHELSRPMRAVGEGPSIALVAAPRDRFLVGYDAPTGMDEGSRRFECPASQYDGIGIGLKG
jgi:hypothetical protein